MAYKPYRRKYYRPFSDQMYGAKKRGIEWQFDYETWVKWWGNDIDKRGPYKDQLVMARYGDTGPYHPDNVFKCTASENCKLRQDARKQKYGTYTLNRW
jgi:hypothetical protein